MPSAWQQALLGPCTPRNAWPDSLVTMGLCRPIHFRRKNSQHLVIVDQQIVRAALK
jgi:hypothetical protein